MDNFIKKIMTRLVKHSEFLQKVFNGNEYYRNGDFHIHGEYTGAFTKIVLLDKYGLCTLLPAALLKNGKPSLRTALDKSQYYVNMVTEIHGDKYDYSRVCYFNNVTPIEIICKNHGLFKQIPHVHASGGGCMKCKGVKSKERRQHTLNDFIKSAKRIHGDKYDYSKAIYENAHIKIDIICKKHGVFSQSPNSHLSKKAGCSKCGFESIVAINREKPSGWTISNWKKKAAVSKTFESFKVYIVKCWNENETFYKIGRTFQTIPKRFKCIPYKYEIIYVAEGDASEIFNLEILLKRLNKPNKIVPSIKFDGMYECFNNIKLK